MIHSDITQYEEDLVLEILVIPNLDNISLRRSKRNKPSVKTMDLHDPTLKKLYGLLDILYLFDTAIISANGHVIPPSVVDKVVLHIEDVINHLDGTLKYIPHSTLVTHSHDNDIYTHKTMLQYDDRNEYARKRRRN